MTSWEIIKNHFTLNVKVGTVGYLFQISNAINMFESIKNNIKDSVISQKQFNNDKDVHKVSINKKTLDNLKSI